MRDPFATWLALAALALPAPVRADARGAPILDPDGAPPPILERLELSGEERLLDFAAQGTLAVVASTRGEARKAESTVRVFTMTGPPRELQVPGRVRDVMFSPDESEILAIQQRPARKKRAAECFLLRIDLNTLKARRALYLPATARDLAHWPAGGALLIAARDEVRSLLLPDLRSGPLYRLPGENHAVAAVDGSRVIVGREGQVLLVDLADSPEREGMPVRAAAEVPGTVVQIALSRTGQGGLARLADDRLFRVRLSPLALEPLEPQRAAPSAPVATVLPEAASTPAPTPAPAPAAAAVPPVAPRAPSPPGHSAPRAESGGPVLAGHVRGAAADGPLWVVAYGPDDILREAGRTVPAADGSWRLEGLGPGRYRVVLDGGGARVLVTEPRFHVVDLGADPPSAPGPLDFRIVRSM